MFVEMCYKPIESEGSTLVEFPALSTTRAHDQTSRDFLLASALGTFGTVLRGSGVLGDAAAADALAVAEQAAGYDPSGYREELTGLIKLHQ
jgi:hypothetical protein